MAKFVVPSGARMRLVWSNNGVLAMNVFGGKAAGSGTVTGATATALADIVEGAWASSGVAIHVPATVRIESVGIRNVNTADLPEFTAPTTGTTGTAATEGLPRSNAFVVTFRTAKAGKRNRGRSFFPGLAEGENDANGVATPAARDAIVAFWTAMMTNMSGIGYQLAIIGPALPSRPGHDGELLPAEPANNEAVISVESRSLMWGSQRRRNHRL